MDIFLTFYAPKKLAIGMRGVTDVRNYGKKHEMQHVLY